METYEILEAFRAENGDSATVNAWIVEKQKYETVVSNCFTRKQTWEGRVQTEKTEGCVRNISNSWNIKDG